MLNKAHTNINLEKRSKHHLQFQQRNNTFPVLLFGNYNLCLMQSQDCSVLELGHLRSGLGSTDLHALTGCIGLSLDLCDNPIQSVRACKSVLPRSYLKIPSSNTLSSNITLWSYYFHTYQCLF